MGGQRGEGLRWTRRRRGGGDFEGEGFLCLETSSNDRGEARRPTDFEVIDVCPARQQFGVQLVGAVGSHDRVGRFLTVGRLSVWRALLNSPLSVTVSKRTTTPS